MFAALSVAFDQIEHEDVLQTCVDGLLALAKISTQYHFGNVLDDLVVPLCKFTTLLTPSSIEEAIVSFEDDARARMATTTVFKIANSYGDDICSSWRNILDCVLSLHKLGLRPARLASDAADEMESTSDHERGKHATTSLSTSQRASVATAHKSSSLIGRFSQLLSFDMEEPRLQPMEEQLVARQHLHFCCRSIQEGK